MGIADNGQERRIMLVAGLYDLEQAGNQTLRRTIEGYLRASWTVDLFTFMPRDHPNLLSPTALGAGVQIRRLPGFLRPAVRAGAAVRDRLGHARRRRQSSAEPVDYYGELNVLGRALYIGFLLGIFVPVQSLRVAWHALRRRPEAIYGLNCQGAVVASLVGRLLRIPVVTRFYGVGVSAADLLSVRRRLWNFDEILGVKANSDLLIMTNDGTRGADLARRLGHPESHVLFLMNGIELGGRSKESVLRASVRPAPPEDEEFRLLMVSRLARWKRVDRGIRALSQALTAAGRRITLTVVGDGEDRGALEKLAQVLEVTDGVRFAGAVAHSQIGAFFSHADALLSLYDVSNLGNPVIEALAHGLPVITIDDGSTDGLLEQGVNALLVSKTELDTALPTTLRRLADDRHLWEKLSSGARRTFLLKVPTWEERMRVEVNAVESLVRRSSK